MRDFLSGKKTYLVAVSMVIYAILGVALGQLDAAQAGELILQALGFATLRLGVAKAE